MFAKTEPKTLAIGTRFNLFKSEQFDLQFIRALAYASSNGAAIGECLSAAAHITDRDTASWVKAWSEIGARIEQIAHTDLERGHRVSARGAFLRAFNYYRSAEFWARISTGEAAALYRKYFSCFANAGALFDPPFEAVQIPYEGKTLPGWFFRVDNSPARRPTLVLCGGGDASGEELYFFAGREAKERGYNLLVFHGPGHHGALYQDASLVFRYDYEVPLKAVMDYALGRPEVDAERLALMGVSLGGYFTPRGAAFDQRIKALIVDPPISDWHRVLISFFETALGRPPAFIESVLVKMAEHFLPRSTLESQFWQYGVNSGVEYMQANEAFRLGDLPKQITCPTLCLWSAGEDQEIHRQSQEFFDTLSCPKQSRFFTSTDGADSHCQVNNLALAYQVVFDWLDETLA